jgi:hypothetical protein
LVTGVHPARAAIERVVYVLAHLQDGRTASLLKIDVTTGCSSPPVAATTVTTRIGGRFTGLRSTVTNKHYSHPSPPITV